MIKHLNGRIEGDIIAQRRRTFLGLTIGSILFMTVFNLNGIASAHEFRIDNGVRVVMHIEPDDDPRPKIVSQIVFVLSGNLSIPMADCVCKATLTRDNRTILTKAPMPNGNGGEVTMTFPEAGSYTLTLQGSSRSEQFGDFKVSYPVEVAAVSPQSAWGVILVLGTILIAGPLAVLGFIRNIHSSVTPPSKR